MNGKKIMLTRNNPCQICGKPDWCFRMDFGQNGILHYCNRTAESGIPAGYIVRQTFPSGCVKLEEESQYERNRQKYLEEKGYKDNGNRKGYKPSANVPVLRAPEKEVIEYPVAPPQFLDKVYRTFLSLLCLEQRHKKILEDEWNQGIEPNLSGLIFSKFPIKSVPPPDKIRKASGEYFENRTRSQIMNELVRRVGEPFGVPGFFSYTYEGKRIWTFSPLAGIVYPIYNSHGQIVRVRIADDYPEVQDIVTVDGKKVLRGYYHYTYDGEWIYSSADGKRSTIVRSLKKGIDHKKFFNKKGLPVGKVMGKYKNFTSYKELEVEKDGKTYIVNKYENGCKSGSSISVYGVPGCDKKVVYITEGEKKAIVMCILLNCYVISVPGVSSWGKLFEKEDGYLLSVIDELVKQGAEVFNVLYDADKEANAMVLQSECNAAEAFLERGLHVGIGEWNANIGKGADDIAILGIRPYIEDYEVYRAKLEKTAK